eukprot:JP436535.1.p1 GENE.JP436535.1~~JP436535.1.p1  ORF type:complete len:232 (+),score=32.13 JP436535.1:35-697(+)
MDPEVLKADISELENILASVSRPNNRHHIESHLASVKGKLAEAERKEAAKAQAAQNATVSASDKVNYTTISQFGWDQEGKNIKVYISLDGVGSLPSESVTCEFGLHSFDLKVVGLQDKNYRLYPKNLMHPIVTESCKYTVRANRVVVTLVKQESKHWDKLEGKPLATPKPDMGTDPSKGIMDMMKNMYEEGDDDMKRTIAKAWSESQNKQGGGLPDLPDM